MLAATILTAAPAFAAPVTFERLVNADKEPQNWLMNHRTYDGQRFSPLDRINKQNVKSLHLAYAVALGGSAVNENIEATPLVEDGFLYIVDQWGIVYKIDVRSGDAGRIVWHMDPKQEKPPSWGNRGVALWGNLRDLGRRLTLARDRHRQGDRQGCLGIQHAGPAGAWSHLHRAAGHQGPGRDRLVRRRPRHARLDRFSSDAATGKAFVEEVHGGPAPGEPGSETWKDKEQRLGGDRRRLDVDDRHL